MKELPPFLIYTAIILAVVLTANVVSRTAQLNAEKRYLQEQKPRFLQEIREVLTQQQNFTPYADWEYYSYDYVMKMQEDSTYPIYRDLHRYQ